MSFVPTFFTPQRPSLLADMCATPAGLSTWVGAEAHDRLAPASGHEPQHELWGSSSPVPCNSLLRRTNPRLLTASPIVPLATLLSLLVDRHRGGLLVLGAVARLRGRDAGPRATWYALRAVAPRPACRRWTPACSGSPRWGWVSRACFMAWATSPDLFTNGSSRRPRRSSGRRWSRSTLALAAMFGTSTLAFWTAYVGFHFSHGAECYRICPVRLAPVPATCPASSPAAAPFSCSSSPLRRCGCCLGHVLVLWPHRGDRDRPGLPPRPLPPGPPAGPSRGGEMPPIRRLPGGAARR